jgi:hypothetical protein
VGCASDANKRGWSVVTKGTEPLDNVKDARGVAFLDMDEDVSLLALIGVEIHHEKNRARSISWSKELGRLDKGRLCSCRIISTMMRSSSRRSVGIFFSFLQKEYSPD